MRFALRQLMLAFAILGAVFALTQSGGCGAPWSYVSHVAYSPDGKWISATLFNGRDARVPGKRYKADIYRTVQLLSADGDSYHTISREFLPGNQGPFHPRDSAPSVRFREQTSEIYVAAWQAKRIDLFDCQTLVKFRTLTAPWTTVGKYGFGIAFAPDADRLYVTDEPGVYAINVSHDQPSDWQLISNFGRSQSDLILSASGKYACLHSYLTGSTLVDLRTGQALTSIGDDFESLCFSPTDEELLIALPKKLEFFNPNTLTERAIPWNSSIWATTWLADGKSLAISDGDRISIIDPQSGKQLAKLNAPDATTMSSSPDSKYLAVGGSINQVELWDIATQKSVWKTTVPGGYRLPWTVPATLLTALVWLALRQRRSQVNDRKMGAVTGEEQSAHNLH